VLHLREEPLVLERGQRQRPLGSGGGRSGADQHPQPGAGAGDGELARVGEDRRGQRQVARPALQRGPQPVADRVVGERPAEQLHRGGPQPIQVQVESADPALEHLHGGEVGVPREGERRQLRGGRRAAVQLGGGGGAGGGVHRWPLSGSWSRAPASSAGGPGNKTAATARTGPDPSPATTAGPGTAGARLRGEGGFPVGPRSAPTTASWDGPPLSRRRGGARSGSRPSWTGSHARSRSFHPLAGGQGTPQATGCSRVQP